MGHTTYTTQAREKYKKSKSDTFEKDLKPFFIKKVNFLALCVSLQFFPQNQLQNIMFRFNMF